MTTTPTPTIHMLEEMMAKAPTGPWKREGDYTVASVPAPGLHVANCRSYQDGRLDYENSDSATALIVALRNATPHLLAALSAFQDIAETANGQWSDDYLWKKWGLDKQMDKGREAMALLQSVLSAAGGEHE